MPLHPLYGHEGVRNRLAGAIASGRLPQALLLEGPAGIGKQRLALWLAQAVLCETDRAEPCGHCPACFAVARLSHPDVHWFVPLEPSKKSVEPDKQVEFVAEALGEEMAARRENPLYAPPSGLAGHAIAAVRLLLKHLVLTPAVGRRKVFIIGDAERLIPQVGQEAAANALLKALEEPPADTQFILTAADPDALLPTVLSRIVRVRMARIPDSVVTAFVQNELHEQRQDTVLQLVRAAEGRPGRLLADSRVGSGADRSAEELLAAARSGHAAAYALALKQLPFQARGGFTEMLDALLARLGREARASTAPSRKLTEAIASVLEARERAQGNVNPQLLAATLADELAGT
jgi:DNA polymerase III subunit delta'